MSRLITTQSTPNILVANIDGAGDPSLGLNPIKLRTGFERQLAPEVARYSPTFSATYSTSYGRAFDGHTPGTHTLLGKLTGGPPPVGSAGTVAVVDNDFSVAATIYLGDYNITSGIDFAVATATQAVYTLTVAAAPSTATIDFDGIISLVPAGGARTPGANNYNNTLGTVNAIAAEIAAALADGANGFTPLFTVTSVVGPVVTITAVPIGSLGNGTITPSNGTVTAATITVGVDAVDNTATNLAAAISLYPGFSAVAGGPVVTITGPVGPNGNNAFFDVEYTGTVENYTLSTPFWYLSGAEPYIGPPIILT